MQIADMMKELREKGLGEAEIANAHAQWLEEEDDKALKNIIRSVKNGFMKGRKRVAVCPQFSFFCCRPCRSSSFSSAWGIPADSFYIFVLHGRSWCRKMARIGMLTKRGNGEEPCYRKLRINPAYPKRQMTLYHNISVSWLRWSGPCNLQ